ncbi:MAG: pyridoxal-dependent decarboxylase [Gemmatimonadota bacterium]|nr:pyridoxal-dependent decarboxylase [Gemmatimonadota bacterium]MDH3423462.1 pyridoxal-dependent decarboxylase [Gemmatimonadota bacterium]
MAAPYRVILEELRQGFPQPVSDRVHDAYFVFSIMQALEKIDDMKSELPLLGEPTPLDYDAARRERLSTSHSTVEDVTRDLVAHFDGLPIFSHPRTQVNVVPPTSIASIIGALLPTIYNPNLVSDDTSRGVGVAEERVAAMTALLLGYDPETSAGVFTFGGTGTTLYGVKIGLEKAIPHAMERGFQGGQAVMFSSGQSHYARLNVAGWLGIGEDNVIQIPTHLTNDIKVDLLEEALRKSISEGKRIAAIVATLGTTDAFGIDDLQAIVDLRDRLVDELALDYKPHVHADAVIGWAWSVFNDYDFEENRLGFRPRTVRALAGAGRRIQALNKADSVGIDFHKTGFAPYTSSLFLARDSDDLRLLARGREEMPYLFQSGQRHPGIFTLETSRSGSGVLSALASLLFLGEDGFRTLLGHLVEMAELLREHFEGHAATTVLNNDNLGTVTLFRAYPDGVDTWTIAERERTDSSLLDDLRAHNEYNREIYRYLYEKAMRGEGVLLSMTDCYRHTDYGEPMVALKSYILSPFVDEKHVRLIVDSVLEAREKIGR